MTKKYQHILGKGKTKELELKYEGMWDQNNIPKIRWDHVRFQDSEFGDTGDNIPIDTNNYS